MTIGIFTCVTIHTKYRNDPWKEAIRNYLDFADRVVVVYGHHQDIFSLKEEFGENEKLKCIYVEWPYKWEWGQLPKTLIRGFEALDTDVLLRMDIDYFIHQNDFTEFKEQLHDFYLSNEPVGKTLKVNVLNSARGMIKSRNPNVINSKWKNKITFGQASNRETDWTVPLINTKGCKYPDYVALEEDQVPLLRTWIYNYDYFFCNKQQVKNEFWRFAQAYGRTFGFKWGKTKEESWEVWKGMMTNRLKRSGEKINHPKYIEESIKYLRRTQWGHSNWDLIK